MVMIAAVVVTVVVTVIVPVLMTVPMIVPVIVPVLMTVPVELARGRNRRGRGLVVRRVRAVQDCWAGEEEVIRQHLHGDVRGVEAGHVGDFVLQVGDELRSVWCDPRMHFEKQR